MGALLLPSSRLRLSLVAAADTQTSSLWGTLEGPLTNQTGCTTATLEDFRAWRPTILLPSPGTHGPFEENRFADLGPEVAGTAVPLGAVGGAEAALSRASCERQTVISSFRSKPWFWRLHCWVTVRLNGARGRYSWVTSGDQPLHRAASPSLQVARQQCPPPALCFKSSDELNSDQAVPT